MFRPRRTTTITLICLAIITGLVVGHFYTGLGAWWLAFAGLIFVISLIKKRLWFGLIIFGLALGLWRGEQSRQDYAALQSNFEQKITLSGRIADDPAINERRHYEFTLTDLTLNGESVKGQVKVTTYVSKLKRGYHVEASGKLKPTIGSKQGRMFADIRVLSEEQTWLEQLRQRFFAGVNNALPDPAAAFVLGLLVGARAMMPDELQDQLRLVGLTHIIAVSGYNLTILARAVHRPLQPVSSFLATSLTLWLIFGFLLVSGFHASVVRAAIMALLTLWAAYYGRAFRPLALIGVTAVITATYKPDYIWADLGWQLSFLAFFGITVLAPAIMTRLRLKDTWYTGLLVESSAAHIMTFPLIMVIFGTFSVISPLANLIVLPAIPLLMLFGFLAGLAGMLVPTLAGWASLPALLVAIFVLKTTEALAGIPGSGIHTTASWMLAVLFYGAILLAIAAIVRRHGALPARSERTPLA